jgi:(S)-2-hydroxyglutarate dehydrogenase
MLETDFIIIGCGIIGLSIARELAQKYPGSRIILIEKEDEVAFHGSGRNSGVLHAGFYYSDSSLKAKFTRIGNQTLTAYCLEKNLAINQCGKVVVATNETELEGIHELKRRGDLNGVELNLIDEKELEEIEPNAQTFQYALYSPNTSTVNPKQVCRHIANSFPNTVSILFNSKLVGLKQNVAYTNGAKIKYRYLFNAAGLYADKISHMQGIGTEYTMIPFKGLYLQHTDNNLLQRHIYPVPNLHNPFIGVHFTKTVNQQVKIGPTVTPAFWRENYNFKSRFVFSEFLEILSQEALLFLSNSFNFRTIAYDEIKKYVRKNLIAASSKLIRQLKPSEFGQYTKPGIRAQLLNKNTRELVMDFVVEHGENSTHVLNSVSPAFTSAFPFSKYIVNESIKNFPTGL